MPLYYLTNERKNCLIHFFLPLACPANQLCTTNANLENRGHLFLYEVVDKPHELTVTVEELKNMMDSGLLMLPNLKELPCSKFEYEKYPSLGIV